jgi:hypothetical protein
MRYAKENNYKYEIGDNIGGKKHILFRTDDFVMSQLDEQYIDDDFFHMVADLWKSGASEEDVKAFYNKEHYNRSKKLYDRAYQELVNMRKKKSSSKPKRKPCSCKKK